MTNANEKRYLILLQTIYGIRYTCKQCLYYNLCFKCHNLSAKLHDLDHEFDVTGEMDERMEAR